MRDQDERNVTLDQKTIHLIKTVKSKRVTARRIDNE